MNDLSKNERLVLAALQATKQPLSAYALLDQLRTEGLRAPPQIYRALERLMARGSVHRIESLNSYLACDQPGCSGHSLTAFTICEKCGDVDEFSDPSLSRKLKTLADQGDFELTGSTVELRGTCTGCKPLAHS